MAGRIQADRFLWRWRSWSDCREVIHQDEVAIRLRNDGLSSLTGELASISTTERIAA
jgi:hypothetical protein